MCLVTRGLFRNVLISRAAATILYKRAGTQACNTTDDKTMKTSTKIALLCFVTTVTTAAVAIAGPPPPGFSGCVSVDAGTNAAGQAYAIWNCDQGTVTCWDVDGDGEVDFSDPTTGQGICSVGGNS